MASARAAVSVATACGAGAIVVVGCGLTMMPLVTHSGDSTYTGKSDAPFSVLRTSTVSRVLVIVLRPGSWAVTETLELLCGGSLATEIGLEIVSAHTLLPQFDWQPPHDLQVSQPISPQPMSLARPKCWE